jgi:hypothetical protein
VGFIEVGIADETKFANVDSFLLAGLPTDGISSLNEVAVVAPATPISSKPPSAQATPVADAR